MKRMLGLIVLCVALLATPANAATKSIGKEEVNVRSGPSLEDKIILKLPLGYPIEIQKKKGEWVYFRDWVNNRGWVHRDLISDVRTAVIKVKQANVRSGPGTKEGVVAEASEGEIYKILERKGNWIKIGYYHGDDVVGWVRKDLVFGD